MTFSGLAALVHHQIGTQDSLRMFLQIEGKGLMAILEELQEEGKVSAHFTETRLYQVVEKDDQ